MSGRRTDPSSAEEKQKVEQRCDLALSQIFLSVYGSLVPPLVHLDDPKEVWDELDKRYKTSIQANCDALMESYQ